MNRSGILAGGVLVSLALPLWTNYVAARTVTIANHRARIGATRERHELALERALMLGHPCTERVATTQIRTPAQRSASQIVLHLETAQYAILAHFEVSSQTRHYTHGRKSLRSRKSARQPIHETSPPDTGGG
jgi:hypothetical protein